MCAVCRYANIFKYLFLQTVLFWKEWSQTVQGPNTHFQPALTEAFSLPWMLAQKEQPLAVGPSSATTRDALHSQQPWHRHTNNRLRPQAHLAGFQQPQAFWGDSAVPGNALCAPPDTQAAPARKMLPWAQCQPGQSLLSQTPNEASYSLGTASRKLHLAQLLQGSPGPLGHQKRAFGQAARLVPAEPVLQEVEEHFVHVSIEPSYLYSREVTES